MIDPAAPRPVPFRRLGAGIRGVVNYGNPVQMLWQRWRRASLSEFRVVDRLSGVVCHCRPDAHRMFGEVWFDRDYDVPGVPLRPGDIVADVGANQGFFACYAAYRGCRVVSFEPDADNVGLLRRNLVTNGFADRATVVEAAVTGDGRDVRLFRTDRLGGGMNTTMAGFARNLGFAESDSVLVKGVSLADTLRSEGVERLRLCKMDCEGSELQIVESLTVEDARRIDAFALEFHREAYALQSLLRALDRWGTHHIFPAGDKYCRRDIVYAISKAVLAELT